MDSFYQSLSQWADRTAYHIWSYLLFVLLATGLWLTIRTRFIQVRHLGDSFKLIFAGFLGKNQGKSGRVMSQHLRPSLRPWRRPSATGTSAAWPRPCSPADRAPSSGSGSAGSSGWPPSTRRPCSA